MFCLLVHRFNRKCLLGFGVSVLAMPASVLVQTHFNKHRKFATSISVSGLPLGNLIAPILTNVLIQEFGWRGALMLHTGILLNALVLVQMWPRENVISSAHKPQQQQLSPAHKPQQQSSSAHKQQQQSSSAHKQQQQSSSAHTQQQQSSSAHKQQQQISSAHNRRSSAHNQSSAHKRRSSTHSRRSSAPNQSSTHNQRSSTHKQRSSAHNICKRFFDMSVLRDPLVTLYIVAGMLYRFAIIAIFDHTPSRAVHLGSSLQQAAFLMTVLCFGE